MYGQRDRPSLWGPRGGDVLDVVDSTAEANRAAAVIQRSYRRASARSLQVNLSAIDFPAVVAEERAADLYASIASVDVEEELGDIFEDAASFDLPERAAGAARTVSFVDGVAASSSVVEVSDVEGLKGKSLDGEAEESKKRSHLWGVAAGAGFVIGSIAVAGLTSGDPVDEDDIAAVVSFVHGGAGGGAKTGAATTLASAKASSTATLNTSSAFLSAPVGTGGTGTSSAK